MIPRFGRKIKLLHDRLRNRHHPKLCNTSLSEHLDPQIKSSIASVFGSTMQPTLPALPIEVWEQVIDWLVVGYTPKLGQTVQDNFNLRRDLSACALVCRAWRIRAQMHLFAFLRISGNGLSQYETLILKTPVLCTFAREFTFYNQYVDATTNQVVDKTVETASHAVRIVHKLLNVQYLVASSINLAIEHPHLPRHIAALQNINQLDFYSRTPTKLSQLARILLGLKDISTLYLSVPIIVDSNHLPLPAPCYATKSSLTRLDLVIQPGGYLLVDWLVKARSFTTSLHILFVRLEYQIPQSEIALVTQGVQTLLDNCTGTLEEWNLNAKIQVDDFSSVPKGNVDLKFDLHLLMMVLVSIGSHKSLSKLDFRVSKTWFRHALDQVKTIISKHITGIQFGYWLDKEEEPSNEFWDELDIILNNDMFKPLTSVRAACVSRNNNFIWNYASNFERSEFPALLPNVFKRGILIY